MNAEVKPAVETPEVFDLKSALVQMDVVPGNPELNVTKMLQYIEEAKLKGDDILVFPEMCVPGYLIGDDWLDGTLVKDFENYNERILEATKGSDLVVVWGNVKTDSSKVNEDGTLRKYNAVYVAQGGKFLGERYKTALPNYGEFDDKRYFHSTAQLATEEGRRLESYMNPVEAIVRGTKLNIGAAICEDGWGSGEGNDYAYDVMQMLTDRGSNVLLNLSCSPVKNGKNFRRNQVFGDIAARGKVPLGYINNVGIQNNGKNLIPFDGATTIYNGDGSLQVMKDDFEEGVVRGIMDVPLRSVEQENALQASLLNEEELAAQIKKITDQYSARTRSLAEAASFGENLIDPIKKINRIPETKEAQLENLYQMVLSGIKSFFESTGLKKVVIGLSGGADSALVAKLMVDALGRENVYGVNIPTEYNSDTTKDFAFTLAQELGINYAVFPIQDSYEFTVDQLSATSFLPMKRDTEESEVPVAMPTLYQKRSLLLGEIESDDEVRLNSEFGDFIHLEVSPLNKENIQARKRGNEVLAGIASTLGAVFTNNGNKSESATGYCTVDGDLAGALAPIGDLYKSEVYDLMHYLSEKNGDIPTLARIAESIPSAELSAEHNVDEGKGDPFDYYYHDKILFQLIEMRRNPEDILQWYKDGVLEEKLELGRSLPSKFCATTEDFIMDLERIYRLLKYSVFKRVQGQPIVRVSRKGFGYDLRESTLQGPLYYTQNYRELKSELLST